MLELFELCSLVNLETFETLNRNTVIERIGHKVEKKPWNEIPDTTNRKKVTEHSRNSRDILSTSMFF